MSNIVTQSLTSNLGITISLVSLTNNTSVVSNVIDNSVSLFIGADLQITFTTGASPVSNGELSLFLLKCVNGLATNFDTADPINSELLRSVTTNDTAETTYIASVLIETLPKYWQIMVANNTGDTLDTNPSNFNMIYEGKDLLIN